MVHKKMALVKEETFWIIICRGTRLLETQSGADFFLVLFFITDLWIQLA